MIIHKRFLNEDTYLDWTYLFPYSQSRPTQPKPPYLPTWAYLSSQSFYLINNSQNIYKCAMLQHMICPINPCGLTSNWIQEHHVPNELHIVLQATKIIANSCHNDNTYMVLSMNETTHMLIRNMVKPYHLSMSLSPKRSICFNFHTSSNVYIEQLI